MNRPRLLLVTRNLPPLAGGMERLMSHVVHELAHRFELCVVGPAGCRAALPANVEVLETRGTGLLGFLCQAWWLATAHAWRTRPAGVLAGSGVTAPVAWSVHKLCGAPYAVFVHGLDIIAANATYQRVFVPCIRAAALVIANSVNTRRLSEQAGVKAHRLALLPPGVTFPPSPAAEDFRHTWGIGQRRMLLSVGRIVPRKGLARFIEYTLPAIIERHPDTCLVIIGEEPANALVQGVSESAAIEQAVRKTGLASAVLRCGRLPDDVVTAAYHAADLFVFPVIDMVGDVEGFGMVALEAAAVGLPTCGFRAGGLEDAVIDGATGHLTAPGRYDLLAATINRVLEIGRQAFHSACQAHAEAHDWAHYGDQLSMQVNELIGFGMNSERGSR